MATVTAPALKRYVIQRDIPGIGNKSPEDMSEISKVSCQAICDVGATNVQWVHSYVTADKTVCVYLATGEGAIRKHAELGGFPITSIEEVKAVIDPITASA